MYMNSSNVEAQIRYIALDSEIKRTQIERDILKLQLATVAVVAIGCICLGLAL